MGLNIVWTKNALIGQLVLVAQVGLAPFARLLLVGLSFHAETGRMTKCSTFLWYNASMTLPGWVKTPFGGSLRCNRLESLPSGPSYSLA